MPNTADLSAEKTAKEAKLSCLCVVFCIQSTTVFQREPKSCTWKRLFQAARLPVLQVPYRWVGISSDISGLCKRSPLYAPSPSTKKYIKAFKYAAAIREKELQSILLNCFAVSS